MLRPATQYALTGYWLLATGYWLLATGYWLLATGYWLLATGYWLLATNLVPVAARARGQDQAGERAERQQGAQDDGAMPVMIAAGTVGGCFHVGLNLSYSFRLSV